MVMLLDEVAATDRARGLVSLAQPRYIQGLVGEGEGVVPEVIAV